MRKKGQALIRAEGYRRICAAGRRWRNSAARSRNSVRQTRQKQGFGKLSVPQSLDASHRRGSLSFGKVLGDGALFGHGGSEFGKGYKPVEKSPSVAFVGDAGVFDFKMRLFDGGQNVVAGGGCDFAGQIYCVTASAFKAAKGKPEPGNAPEAKRSGHGPFEIAKMFLGLGKDVFGDGGFVTAFGQKQNGCVAVVGLDRVVDGAFVERPIARINCCGEVGGRKAGGFKRDGTAYGNARGGGGILVLHNAHGFVGGHRRGFGLHGV